MCMVVFVGFDARLPSDIQSIQSGNTLACLHDLHCQNMNRFWPSERRLRPAHLRCPGLLPQLPGLRAHGGAGGDAGLGGHGGGEPVRAAGPHRQLRVRQQAPRAARRQAGVRAL